MNLDRPKKVTFAVIMLYVSLAAGMLRGAFIGFGLPKNGSVVMAWVLFFAAAYFSWLIIFKIQKGKNWARIVCLVIFSAKLPFFRPTFLSSFNTQPIATTIVIVQVVMQIVALVFLYQRKSTEWYRKVKLYAHPDH
ncbi:hypothetical protein SAMN02745119_00948 [Trichlorobacter thiogenes]|uniref:Uncharacterized protein n=1 Tax=Trichlorobacter thiogenes TaxID=115783 RepID=A0A1T4LM04_9BACT|nr:hypothetical protein SAMN02745119_00948 [Trichlorobacter thiogenes]